MTCVRCGNTGVTSEECWCDDLDYVDEIEDERKLNMCDNQCKNKIPAHEFSPETAAAHELEKQLDAMMPLIEKVLTRYLESPAVKKLILNHQLVLMTCAALQAGKSGNNAAAMAASAAYTLFGE